MLKVYLTAGFALFSILFGPGALVFPIQMGLETGSNYGLASLGYILMDQIMPLLGITGALLYGKDACSYFRRLGGLVGPTLVIAIMLMLGPCGVIPRCILMTYSSLNMPIPLWMISALFCVACYSLLTARTDIIDTLGKCLAPALTLCLCVLLVVGLYDTHQTLPLQSDKSWKDGIYYGYQTMVLMASVFLGSMVKSYMEKKFPEENKRIKGVLIAYGIAILGMALVTIGLAKLGVKYTDLLSRVLPEQAPLVITTYLLGKNASVLVALIVLLACLTTACGLADLSADYLKKALLKETVSKQTVLKGILLVSLLASLLGFSTLNEILGTILVWVYPSMIAVVCVGLVVDTFKVKMPVVQYSFYVPLAYNIVILLKSYV